MNFKRVVSVLCAATMVAAAVSGCTPKGNGAGAGVGGGAEPSDRDDLVIRDYADDEIVDWTFFGGMPGAEINDGNEVQEIIAHKTGVRVKETWLTGQTVEEAVGAIIASEDYPTFIDGGDGMQMLYEADALIPWDEYIERYPNIKEFYTPAEWDKFRQSDGHIYWCNQFTNTYGESKQTTHNDEAFWVQARVLEWAGYPTVETLDDYFKLLEDYAAANPDNEENLIPYTMLCEDWRYFCIENAPQFLDGYPNDGSVIVDSSSGTPTIVDYNTTDTAKKYFAKLNEEYGKGIIDPEFATQTYDQYIAKLSNGNVLGMCDQWWDFAFTVNDVFKQTGLDKKGCNYIPLGLTIEKGMDQMWHTYGDTQNVASGLGVTTACEDPERAFAFINNLLDQDIHNLRFWGEEGVDYSIDDQGLFYRTDDMRNKASDSEYKASHLCKYSYFLQWGGTSRDGINAMRPEEQTSDFFADLAQPVVDCFEAYGATTYPDMIGSTKDKEVGVWFPMYSYSNNMNTSTPGGTAWQKMGECKHKYLPQIVMASDFESAWSEYMTAYEECKPQDFLDEMQQELDRRIEAAESAESAE